MKEEQPDAGTNHHHPVLRRRVVLPLYRGRDRTRGLARKHKNVIHMFLLVAIGLSLGYEGAKTADWLFIVLAIACELC